MVVILDNATAHKVDGVRELIEETGARVLYLPPYTPEFNAIEYVWAKIKKFVNRCLPRLKPDLYEAISDALRTITPADAKNFTLHAVSNAI